jgi:2,3-bisphosphoglycerate-independent phosphoglycerate mutase
MFGLKRLLNFKPGAGGCQIKPVVLIVLDGFGIAPPSTGNAITTAKTPNYDRFLKTYPHGELIASGESVGLPAGEVGNTEVGHLTLGAGRVMYQPVKRISMSIEDGSFYDNQAFIGAIRHVKQNQSRLHLMGLIGTGNVHSSVEHLYALLEFCRRENLGPEVFLHLFTDGRDSLPTACLEVVGEIEQKLGQLQVGKIASLAGRYYAMDRDRRWERTELTYKALVLGRGEQGSSAATILQAAYANQITDEFVKPTLVTANGQPIATFGNNDAVIFYNFRVDRPKQLATAFVAPDFENLSLGQLGSGEHAESKSGSQVSTFNRETVPQNLFFVSMTEYQEGLPVSAIAFGPQQVPDSLGLVIAQAGLKQLRMAESEKERFVTYYFNGLHEEAFPGSDTLIIPSPKVPTYDLKPEMSLFKLYPEIVKQLKSCIYHFVICNFANPDMVAHSGNVAATVKAVGYVDQALGELEKAILSLGGTMIITADHGNAEELLSFPNKTFFYTSAPGGVNTEHSANKVPVVFVRGDFQGHPISIPQGALGDVAPTIAYLLGIQPSQGMTGRNLLADLSQPATQATSQ